MISLKQIRQFFSTAVLTIMLAITIGFDFGTSATWAATSLKPVTSQLPNQIATTKNVERKSEESRSIMSGSGDSQAQSAAKAEEFKAKSLEGINNSISNPNYQPGGKTKGAAKKDRQSTKDIKSEAADYMDSFDSGNTHPYPGE